MDTNFIKYVLQNGGLLKRLEIPFKYSEGLGLCNPSVFVDGDDLLLNIRRVNYMFHLSPTHVWNSAYGPTNYHHPDNDVKLRTENFLCRLTPDLDIDENSIRHVDYSKFNTPPQWGFIGEEDARIVRWDGKLYLTGCRRDTETTGISRMELSEVDSNAVEMSRTRIPAPFENDSYCEKNWMPVIDEPYTYVKWCNPLQIVRYNPTSGVTEEVMLKNYKVISDDELCDLRGSSQVINVDGYRIAIVHEVKLWWNRYNEREARYYSRFIVWDENWNIVKLSNRFWFMNYPIEFTTGLAYKDGEFIIPFAVYDNASFICTISRDALFSYIGIDCTHLKSIQPIKHNVNDAMLCGFVNDIENPQRLYDIGLDYFGRRQWGCAHAFFLQAAEMSAADHEKYKIVGYDAFYMAQKCLEMCGGRLDKLIHQYNELIDWDSTRPEAYYELSRLYYGGNESKNDHYTALGYAAVMRDKLTDTNEFVRGFWIDWPTNKIREIFLMQYYICCYRCDKNYVAVDGLRNLMNNGCKYVSDYIKNLGLGL